MVHQSVINGWLSLSTSSIITDKLGIVYHIYKVYPFRAITVVWPHYKRAGAAIWSRVGGQAQRQDEGVPGVPPKEQCLHHDVVYQKYHDDLVGLKQEDAARRQRSGRERRQRDHDELARIIWTRLASSWDNVNERWGQQRIRTVDGIEEAVATTAALDAECREVRWRSHQRFRTWSTYVQEGPEQLR